jgi:hypothetical protein
MTAVLTTFASFDGPNGDSHDDSLIADANGDLFGTTLLGEGPRQAARRVAQADRGTSSAHRTRSGKLG